MNEAPSNHTGLNETFSSQPAPQTNPFTADLKGEFTSNFGTNTNAVSQIFKEGGFVANNRTKYLIIGGVVIAVLAVVFFFLTSGDDDTKTADETADQTDAKDDAGDDAKDDAKDTAAADDAKDDDKTDAKDDADKAAKPAAVPASVPKSGFGGGSGKVSLTEPADGSSLAYDETQGPATFSWTGGGGYIVFSRTQSMHPAALRMPVSGNSYSFLHPWPGTWYWKVENKSGSTEVRSFKVTPPQRRAIQLSQPQQGGSISGNGGTVSWQGDSKVAYYRVELSNGGWANPQQKFASSGNSVTLQGVAAGQYQMRLGAFSEVSGRWEYTNPINVTVQ